MCWGPINSLVTRREVQKVRVEKRREGLNKKQKRHQVTVHGDNIVQSIRSDLMSINMYTGRKSVRKFVNFRPLENKNKEVDRVTEDTSWITHYFFRLSHRLDPVPKLKYEVINSYIRTLCSKV